MTHRTVTSESLEFDFGPDLPPPITQRAWAVATGQLIDELTDEPVTSRCSFHAGVAQVLARSGTDGTFCLVTRPGLRYPPTAPRPTVQVRTSAQGYTDRTAEFVLPFDRRTLTAAVNPGATTLTASSNASLQPGQIIVLGSGSDLEFNRVAALGPGVNQLTVASPLKLSHLAGDSLVPATKPTSRIVMHRVPLSLRGRVVTLLPTGELGPVSNASVRLADFWRTLADVRSRGFNGSVPIGAMTDPLPGARTFAVALRQAVPRRRAAGATARSGGPASTGAVRSLSKGARSGAAHVDLTTCSGLAAGTLIRIGVPGSDTSELRVLDSVVTVSGPAAPGRVAFEAPLWSDHAPGERVEPLAALAGPLPLTLRSDAEAGDRSLFLDALPAATSGSLRVASAGLVDLYLEYSRYEVTSDGQGYFQLPPLHRMAEVRLDVDDGSGAPPVMFFVQPDYALGEQFLNLRLK